MNKKDANDATACEHLLCLKNHYEDCSHFLDDDNEQERRKHAKVYFKLVIVHAYV